MCVWRGDVDERLRGAFTGSKVAEGVLRGRKGKSERGGAGICSGGKKYFGGEQVGI